MSDFFEKAKKFGSIAVDKTASAAEITKNKAKIASQKSDIKDLERRIGALVYEAHKEAEEGEIQITEEIAGLCQSIDAAQDAIAILQEKIEKAKED